MSARRRIDLWNTRTTSSGVFAEAKASGDVFAGAVREDDPHHDCRHRLYTSTAMGLMLLAAVMYLSWLVSR